MINLSAAITDLFSVVENIDYRRLKKGFEKLTNALYKKNPSFHFYITRE